MTLESAPWISATRIWIPVGAALFTAALIGSAVIVPELRLLHFLQGLVYVAIVILARHNSMWGIGASVATAVVWNGVNLFVTHNMQTGAAAFWSLLQTGVVRNLLQMMVLLGWIGHVVLIAACLAALGDRRIADKKLWKLIAGGVVALAYLALIVIATGGPR